MIRHDEAIAILHFADLEDSAIKDHQAARKRGDGTAMMNAAIRWERAENHID